MGKGDPEVVHHRTLSALARVSRSAPALRLLGGLRRRHPSPRTVFGVDFPSAVGLAAGMDKGDDAAQTGGLLFIGALNTGGFLIAQA